MNWIKKSFGITHTPLTLEFEHRGERTRVTTTALLAEGGYSFVYSARGVQSPHRQYAAKKVLTQDEETRAIAETELSVLELLSGQAGVVGFYGSCCKLLPHKQHREYWMLLEFCPHGSLIDLLYAKGKNGEFDRRPALSQAKVLEVFESIVTGVQAMHAQSPPVAHRDLKLENVLATESHEYVLCDFGSATTRRLPAERSRREVIEEEERVAKYSTLTYRAPEMVDLYRNQEVNEKVDVWALGCILFALCFREHPFASESVLQILNADFAIPPGSPYTDDMHNVIKAMLTPDPALRPAASRVLKAVQRLRAKGETEPVAKAEAAVVAEAADVAAGDPPPPEQPAWADLSAGFGDDAAFAGPSGPVVSLQLCVDGGSVRARAFAAAPVIQSDEPAPRAGSGSAPASFSAAFEAEFDAVQAPAPASHAVEDDGFGEFEGAGSGPNVAKEVSFGDFEGADGSAGGPPEWPEVVVGGQKASQ